MFKKSIKDFKVEGQKVILRVDFNVPINKNGIISNDKRIIESLQTIKYLIEQKAKIIIISHLGRPKGEYNESLSLKPVAEYLRKLVDTNVFFSPEVLGPETRRMVRLLGEGEILVLENIRFCKEEEENDLEFANKLARLGDIYCNDAFGTAHRKHASISGITNFLPSCCGFLMQRELEMLDKMLNDTKHPFVVVLGGAKIKDKIGLFNHLLDKVDKIIVGGAMAYTFLNALGFNTGQSFVEKNKIEFARLLLEKAKSRNVQVFLPVDHVVASEFSFMADYIVCTTAKFPVDGIGMDIGPESIKLFSKQIKNAKTIFWNGPMGVFEYKRFSKGTNGIAKAIAKNNNMTVVGGGESLHAISNLKLEEKFTHVSTGGGASLTYLEGSEMPGLINIEEKGEPIGSRMNLNILKEIKK